MLIHSTIDIETNRSYRRTPYLNPCLQKIESDPLKVSYDPIQVITMAPLWLRKG